MGAFRYCSKCKNGLERPTIQEDLLEWYGNNCPHCGEEQDEGQTLGEWVVELYGELKELKEKLNETK